MKQPEKYFLYVGNAYPHKNLERLLEAIANLKFQIACFEQVSCRKANFKFVMVGPDDYFYQKLKEKVQKMGLLDQVIFHGPATKEELTDLYKNALVLIFPSLMEGFGLPGIEAMANGCPVLCSDISVFHEIYGEAAIYFNPLDINDIKNKAEQFCFHDLNHSIRDRLVADGSKQAKKYSWQKLARETLDIYNNCLKS